MKRIPDHIRIRAGIAAVHEGRILLLPHYHTDAGPVQWVIPGGRVEFCESVRETALREFREETGLQAEITGLLDVSEVVLPERPYHSLSVTFAGRVVGGEIAPENDHPFGTKVPRWFSWEEIEGIAYHPKTAVRKAFDSDQNTNPGRS